MQWGPPPNILECRKDYIKPLFFSELYETRFHKKNGPRFDVRSHGLRPKFAGWAGALPAFQNEISLPYELDG